jgi:hypothetical protein
MAISDRAPRYWFDGPPPRGKADRVAEVIVAGEQAIENVPAWLRSWAPAEEKHLRESLPELAAELGAEEIYQRVHAELTAAATRNWKSRRPSHVR